MMSAAQLPCLPHSPAMSGATENLSAWSVIQCVSLTLKLFSLLSECNSVGEYSKKKIAFYCNYSMIGAKD